MFEVRRAEHHGIRQGTVWAICWITCVMKRTHGLAMLFFVPCTCVRYTTRLGSTHGFWSTLNRPRAMALPSAVSNAPLFLSQKPHLLFSLAVLRAVSWSLWSSRFSLMKPAWVHTWLKYWSERCKVIQTSWVNNEFSLDLRPISWVDYMGDWLLR